MLKILDLALWLPLLAAKTGRTFGPMLFSPSSVIDSQNICNLRAGFRWNRHVDIDREAVAVFNGPVYQPLTSVACGTSLLIALRAITLKALLDDPFSTGCEALGNGIAAKHGASSVLSLN